MTDHPTIDLWGVLVSLAWWSLVAAVVLMVWFNHIARAEALVEVSAPALVPWLTAHQLRGINYG